MNPDSSSLHITAQDWPYRDLGTPLTGVLCRDELPGVRPGILLIHGGAGLDEHARERARRYAELGYIVLACDMLTGQRGWTPQRYERFLADAWRRLLLPG